MTKNFDLFVESLIKSFVDLPDFRPYGFWVSPTGKIYKVGNMMHDYVAEDIIEFFEPKLKEEYEKLDYCPKDFLIYKGYIRLVFTPDGLSADNEYYNFNGRYVTVKNTNTAIKTVKDIAAFYNTDAVFIDRR